MQFNVIPRTRDFLNKRPCGLVLRHLPTIRKIVYWNPATDTLQLYNVFFVNIKKRYCCYSIVYSPSDVSCLSSWSHLSWLSSWAAPWQGSLRSAVSWAPVYANFRDSHNRRWFLLRFFKISYNFWWLENIWYLYSWVYYTLTWYE